MPLTKLRTPIEAAKLWHTRYVSAEGMSIGEKRQRTKEEADLAFEQDLINAGFRTLFDDAILEISYRAPNKGSHVSTRTKAKVVVILESGCELHFPIL